MAIRGKLQAKVTTWPTGATYGPDRFVDVVDGVSNSATPWCLSFLSRIYAGVQTMPRYDMRTSRRYNWWDTTDTLVGASRGALIIEWDQGDVAADLVSGIFAIPPSRTVKVRAVKNAPQAGDFVAATLAPGVPLRFSRLTVSDQVRIGAGSNTTINRHELHEEFEVMPVQVSGGNTPDMTEILRVSGVTGVPPAGVREYQLDPANSQRWPPAPWSIHPNQAQFRVINAGAAERDVLIRQFLAF